MNVDFLEDAEPLQEAVRKISDKTPIGSLLSSAELQDAPLALRERAFFSAKFAAVDQLEIMHEKLNKRIGLLSESVARGERMVSRSSFISDMRKELAAAGVVVDPNHRGGLRDITSARRLGLIFDINIQQAQEFARFQAGQTEGALAAFPAQQLYREQARDVPRKWLEIWKENGGKLTKDGRMIALKSDTIWYKISRFGVPYPPFDFMSGMGTRDISREEAVELGLIKKAEKPKRADIKFNDKLQASVTDLSPKNKQWLKKSFGDQVDVGEDVARWKGQNHDFTYLFDVTDGGGGKAATDAMKGMNMIIGRIHEMPSAPILPIIDHVTLKNADGEYWPVSTKANRIGVLGPRTSTGKFAQAHEVGHFVDEWVFGEGKGFGSQALKDDSMVNLMQKITDSRSFLEALARDQVDIQAGVRVGYYWTVPAELFARAYAQWIALKAKDPALDRELGIRQGYPGVQWDAKDFAPIAKAMDQLFAVRGLLK